MLMDYCFWQTLPRPILGLSPMSGITDQPFRHIQKRYGDPAVVYTEFTPVEGYFTRDARLLRDFLYDETQRPVVAQIYGRSPAHFRQMAVLICQLGFDGIPAYAFSLGVFGAAAEEMPQGIDAVGHLNVFL